MHFAGKHPNIKPSPVTDPNLALIASMKETLQFETSKPLEPVDSFDDLPISDALLRGIYSYGFEKPSGVQRIALPAVLSSEDVVVQAKSGSGKTAVFVIAALHSVSEKNKVALILSPTRELAEQTGKVARALGDSLGVVVEVMTGGHSVKTEKLGKPTKTGTVISGTPGRVGQLLKDVGLVEMWKNVNLVVLDEADELLLQDQGFTEQIKNIMHRIKEKKIILVSATLPDQVLTLTGELMKDPVKILVKTEKLTVKEIRQFIYPVDEESQKIHAICDIYDRISVSQSIIFCNTKTKVEALTKQLLKAKFPAACIHGDMPQKSRDSVIAKFRAGQLRLLVTSDVIGRGIDVHAVALVLCHDLPLSNELYLHRIGRSGRFGRKGLAINLVLPSDEQRINELEGFYGIDIPEFDGQAATA